MSSDLPRQGLLDTSILLLRRWIDPGELPDEMAIRSITLAELSAGPHEAARIYGRVTAAVIAAGRKPRRRIAGLMIAATAIAEDLPLFTANPADFAGLDALLRIIPVTRPDVPHEQPRSR